MVQQVAIRLGTTGKAEVKSDFAEVRTAGTGAMKSIADGARQAGDIGEREAKRLSGAYDRATADLEAAERRRANASMKLASFTPRSGVQQSIALGTGAGLNDNAKSAKESAIFFAQMAAEQEKLEQRTHAFRMALEPAYAAQQRFNAEIAEARTLVAAGTITLDQYCDKLRQEQALLSRSTALQQQVGAAASGTKAGMQQLSMQMNDMATMWAMGAKPMQIFASQAGQVIQAVQLMSGGTSKVAAFMGGPWGMAITTGAVVLAPLIAKLFETKDALDDMGKAAETAMAKLYASLSQADKFTDAATEGSQKIVNGLAQVAAIDRGIAVLEKHLAERPGSPLDGKFSVQLNKQLEDFRNARRLAVDNIDRARSDLSNLSGLRVVEAMQDRNKALMGDEPDAQRKPRSTAAAERAAARKLEREADERASIVAGFQNRFDPQAAIERRKNEELAQLAKVQAIVSPEAAKTFQSGILADAQKALFKLQFPDDEKRQERLAQYKSDQADALAITEAEGRLIYANENERERALSILQMKLQLVRDGTGAETEDGKAILASHVALLRKNEAIEDLARNWNEAQRIGESFIDTVLDVSRWDDWGNIGKQVLNDLMNDMIRLAAINPLKNLLFGGDLPTLGGVIGGVIGAFKGGFNATALASVANAALSAIPLAKLASGSEYFSGGRALVGEQGQEIVDLPAGSRIHNAAHTRRMLANDNPPMSVNVNYHIDATGADPAGLARVEAQLAQSQRNLPGEVLNIVTDAMSRRVLR